MNKKFKLAPGPLPELNAVAEAVMLLELDGADAVPEAINTLRDYCEFVRAFEHKPIFWHDWKQTRRTNND